MTDIEPIITAWLLSPIGLIVSIIVTITAIVLSMAKLMTTYPSKEY